MKRLLLPILFVTIAAAASAQTEPAAATAATPDTIRTKSGLTVIINERGEGKRAKAGQLAVAHYVGRLDNGSVFDSSQSRGPFAFRIGKGQVIKGWDEGFALLRVGDKARLIIPSKLAYGEKGRPSIPANSRLTFDVELLELWTESLGETISSTIDKKGIEQAMKVYNRLKKSEFKDIYLSESELNNAGYTYLNAEKTAEAIAVFKLAVELFPESSNVYDSLGEAYMKAGDTKLAIANYERSLELDRKNTNAVEMLKQLRAK